jgi:hypothetical protein
MWFGFACYVRVDVKKMPKSKWLNFKFLQSDVRSGHSQGGKIVLISAIKSVKALL